MNKIGSYEIYQKNYYAAKNAEKEAWQKAEGLGGDNRVKAEGLGDGHEKTNAAERTGKTNQVELSDAAKEMLKKLQKKYANMDFIVANYSSEEEAAEYLSRGTKEYSVLIEPEVLEQMAADEEAEKQYMQAIEDSTSKIAEAVKQLSDEEREQIGTLGVSVDATGKFTFYATLEAVSKNRSEWLSRERESRKAERIENSEAQQERLEKDKSEVRKEHLEKDKPEIQKEHTEKDWSEVQKKKTTVVKADTVEGLLEQIKNVDWNSIAEKEVEIAGSRIDYFG